jgi:hypothetical protein
VSQDCCNVCKRGHHAGSSRPRNAVHSGIQHMHMHTIMCTMCTWRLPCTVMNNISGPCHAQPAITSPSPQAEGRREELTWVWIGTSTVPPDLPQGHKTNISASQQNQPLTHIAGHCWPRQSNKVVNTRTLLTGCTAVLSRLEWPGSSCRHSQVHQQEYALCESTGHLGTQATHCDMPLLC